MVIRLTLLLGIFGCRESDAQRPDVRSEQAVIERTHSESAGPSDIEDRALRARTPTRLISGQVVSIVDGDTIDILIDVRTNRRIRFYGIDAPEYDQPFGEDAKQFVVNMISGKLVRMLAGDVDRFGQTICDVYVEENLVNLEILRAGLAWYNAKFAPGAVELAAAEAEARAARRGLWSDPKRVPPWQWRNLDQQERDQLR